MIIRAEEPGVDVSEGSPGISLDPRWSSSARVQCGALFFAFFTCNSPPPWGCWGNNNSVDAKLLG